VTRSACTCSTPTAAPKAPRLGKWERWFAALKTGDQVWIQFPWQDGKRAGGRRVIATVGHCPNSRIRVFRYRQVDGSRWTTNLRYWQGDSYTHVMPIGHRVRYSPARGFLMARDSAPTAASPSAA
jgi:hypothetical protein